MNISVEPGTRFQNRSRPVLGPVPKILGLVQAVLGPVPKNLDPAGPGPGPVSVKMNRVPGLLILTPKGILIWVLLSSFKMSRVSFYFLMTYNSLQCDYFAVLLSLFFFLSYFSLSCPILFLNDFTNKNF